MCQDKQLWWSVRYIARKPLFSSSGCIVIHMHQLLMDACCVSSTLTWISRANRYLKKGEKKRKTHVGASATLDVHLSGYFWSEHVQHYPRQYPWSSDKKYQVISISVCFISTYCSLQRTITLSCNIFTQDNFYAIDGHAYHGPVYINVPADSPVRTTL